MVDTIHYFVGNTTDLSYTTNPNDKPLYRQRNYVDSTNTPIELLNEVQIVDFLDPFNFTEAVGFIYDQIPNFSTRLGVGMKQTWSDKFAATYSDDPDTPNEIEKFRNETGIESVTEYSIDFLENMNFNTYLRLFGRFEDLSVWDVRWDNTITAKVNKYVSVNLNVLVIYDVSESLKTQIKEALQLGISYTLF